MGVGVSVAVGFRVGVAVGLGVGVAVGFGVRVGVAVGSGVGEGGSVRVTVAVGVGVGGISVLGKGLAQAETRPAANSKAANWKNPLREIFRLICCHSL